VEAGKVKGSLERALLMVTGASLVFYALNGPIASAMSGLYEERAKNCVNLALKAADLSLINSIGGGGAHTYVYIPCEVYYSGDGHVLTMSSGGYSASISYPFKVGGKGVAHGFGKFLAVWSEGSATIMWARS